jgi:2,3-dihydroxybiphenyl 1,2-dioxygenase
MTVQALGYVGFGSSDLDDWGQFGTGLVGLQAVERSPSLLAFRMDDRKQRIVVDRALPEGARFFGWEVADAAALDALATRLEAAEVEVVPEPGSLADNRRVKRLISFHDPAGNRLEAFYGAEIDDAPFRPGRSISGFRTGPLGLGHAVLTVENIDAVMPFYLDVLGFGLSDYMQKPFRAYFFHVNARHHSLALIETGHNGMHHLMVELFSLDDVGQCYDIALGQQDRVNVTLGRHTNDFMTSFYAKTPSSFMVECGWAAGRSTRKAGNRWSSPTVRACGAMSGSGCRPPTAKWRARCGCAPRRQDCARRCRSPRAIIACSPAHVRGGTTSVAARIEAAQPRCFLKNAVARPQASSAAARSCTDCRCSLTKACSAS